VAVERDAGKNYIDFCVFPNNLRKNFKEFNLLPNEVTPFEHKSSMKTVKELKNDL